MNRWSLASGLTVILLLLLLLSGYCVWITRGLTDDIAAIIGRNYETIHANREMRSAMMRLSAHYLGTKDVASIPDTREVYEHEHAGIERQLRVIAHNSDNDQQRELAGRLAALLKDYFGAFDELLALKPRAYEPFARLNAGLSSLTGVISALSDQIVDHSEAAIMQRRDDAVILGRRSTFITLGFAILSVGIYAFTSVRMTRALFEPLRRLRDSIQQVSDRRFEALIPLEGGDELGQIATSFNRMAGELHHYINETDERALHANRVSRAILEALPYPVYIVDSDFNVRLMNPQAETLSQNLQIPGAMPGEVRRQIDKAAGQGTELIGDDLSRAIRLHYPKDTDGKEASSDYLPQIFRMPVLFNEQPGWAVLLVDMTRVRRLDDAKTKAIATLGHEVKTPVTGIRMALHLVLEEKFGQLTAEQRELLESARDNCERLLAVLQALLELARLESGRTTLTLAPHPPAELLESALAAHGEIVRLSGGEINLDVAPDLPAVLAEPIHAARVLDNFLTNAAKYGTHGRPIILRAQRRNDGYVRLGVINHGDRVLTDAEQAKVFEPFFRRPGETAEGTGLGLAISREIALLHGGRVGVYCPPEEGTVEFFLDLRSVA
jgi:two-component system, NtrC family, sensor histidine kinase KinB